VGRIAAGGATAWLSLGIAIGFQASLPGAEPMTIQSRSGQFVLQGLTLLGAPLGTGPKGSEAYLRLDPTVVAVSCERIKRTLLDRLGMQDQWRGRILISIRQVRRNDEPILVNAIHFKDGWQYRMELPEHVERRRFLTTMTELLLLEIANRGSGPVTAELPVWLGMGLSEIMDAESMLQLTLEPDQGMARQIHNLDPLRQVRQLLQTRPPLPLEALNWPTDDQLGGDEAPVYSGCAHLMVQELLNLRNGEQCLRQMLRLMPEHLNWQAAFLRAFDPYFKRILDLDKWWSLVLVHQTGRDLSFTWSESLSWEKLDHVLSTPIQVRLESTDLPMTAPASLQSIIQEWEYRRQLPVLTVKLNHLHALRLRVSQELMPLVDDYREALGTYLQQRSQPGLSKLGTVFMASPPPPLVLRTQGRLDDLDRRREILRAKMRPRQP
jgi:hypothetical protein